MEKKWMIDLKYLKEYVRFAGPLTQIPLYIYRYIIYWILLIIIFRYKYYNIYKLD